MFLKIWVIDGEYIVKKSRDVYKVVLYTLVKVKYEIPLIWK